MFVAVVERTYRAGIRVTWNKVLLQNVNSIRFLKSILKISWKLLVGTSLARLLVIFDDNINTVGRTETFATNVLIILQRSNNVSC